MAHLQAAKLLATAGVAVAGLVGVGGVAHAAPGSSADAVSCVNGDGVLSLTITNTAADAGAEFVVTNPETFVASVIDLAPATSQLVTVDGLSDGSRTVPVLLNGTDASVTVQISCDVPACADGVLTVVTDDSGVQHHACVASASAAPAIPDRASLAPSTQRTTTARRTVLPATGSGTGGLVIAGALVGTGSAVSLFSRRRRSGRRKGFRRRGGTP